MSKTLNDFIRFIKHSWHWGIFSALLFLNWRRINLWTEIPGYGDTLEVVWGLQWYYDSLTTWQSPFHYPLIFHPQGWSLGSFAHLPLMFLSAQPIMFLTENPVFTYNMLAIASMFVAFVGARRFFALWSANSPAIVGALAWTFAGMRTFRAIGHLHTLWMTAFFGWMAYFLLRMRREKGSIILTRSTIFAGISFGLMINSSLYSLFLGGLLFLLLIGALRSKVVLLRGIAALILGLICGIPALGPVLLLPGGSISAAGLTELNFWGTNIDSLFMPSFSHPVRAVRDLAHTIYSGSYNESANQSFGLVAGMLALIGAFKQKMGRVPLLTLALVGLMFATGPFLKVGGQPIEILGLENVRNPILQFGQSRKPELFSNDNLNNVGDFVPLPYSVLVSVIPRLEGARTVGRFAYLTVFAVFGLASIGLSHVRRPIAVLLSIIWLFETLPLVLPGAPIDLDVRHPAYEWLSDQKLGTGEGIFESTTLPLHGGEVLYSSYQNGVPTAGFVGSFLPDAGQRLMRELWLNGYSKGLIDLLNQFEVKYLFVHLRDAETRALWENGTITSLFPPIACFDAIEGSPTPFSYKICVSEVPYPESDFEAMLEFGLSDHEPWGVWSLDTHPRARFLRYDQQPHRLVGEVFPYCVDGRNQVLAIAFNDRHLDTLVWSDCAPKRFEFLIDGSQMEQGINELKFELDYALSPQELGVGSDPRRLGVGFNQLQLLPLKD